MKQLERDIKTLGSDRDKQKELRLHKNNLIFNSIMATLFVVGLIMYTHLLITFTTEASNLKADYNNSKLYGNLLFTGLMFFVIVAVIYFIGQSISEIVKSYKAIQ